MKRYTGPMMCILLFVAILAACGKEESTATSGSKNTVDELKIGLPIDVGPLNIYTGNLDWLTDMVYDKLFAASPYTDKPIPWLAESAKKLDDTTWEVVIRDGIKWHDGEDFTAEDVKFTYEYYRDGPQNRHTHHVNEVPNIEEINIKEDGKTVQFSCAYACPQLDTITFADLPILPEHIWKDVENPRKYTELAIGTGPYKLAEYKEGTSYTLEANNDYFKGQPTIAKITLPIIQDSTAMFNSLKSGEIDVSARTVPTELKSTLLNSGQFKLAESSPLSIVQLGMNFTRAPFDNEEFRDAISKAIDREALVSTVGSGEAGLKGYPHPDSPWTNPENDTPFDTVKSNHILDQLGYEDLDKDGIREDENGKPLSFKLIVSSSEPIYVRVSELISKQLKDIGLDVKVVSEDPTTYAADSNEKKYDFYVSLIGPHGAADPDQFIMSNRSGYLWSKDISYPAMDKLQEEWQKATTADERKGISFEMQTLYNSQPTAVALYYPDEVYAYNSELYDNYVESLGYGIINKYSFLPEDVRKEVLATEPKLVEK